MFDPPDWAGRAALGFEPEDFGDERFEVWPDNWQALTVFSAMRSQWRAGMGGFYGLDLNVLPEMWLRLKVPEADRDEVFESLLQMEGSALAFMHKKKAGP
ncbi:hypothetical protein A9977_05440 [Variovorax sp. UMC13]|nr:hypothetical protein [Variovorax sp. UMC13]